MDFILEQFDEYLLDNVYATLLPSTSFVPSTVLDPITNISTSIISSSVLKYIPHPPLGEVISESVSAWPRDYIVRQAISLFGITWVGINVLYFLFAGLSYYYIFDHNMMLHPRFLKNQVKQEIMCSMNAFPWITIMTLPWFIAEARGYGNFYENVSDMGWTYTILSVPLFLLFTDTGIYWVHRWLHHPLLYKTLHKPHHKWVIPTPFASHAFHPVDGYAQSVPYHVFPFLFPLNKYLYLGLFVFVNFWSIFIHDSELITDHIFEKVINGPSHHTLHHLYFTVNYGQYFTFSDRLGGSYRQPVKELDPMHQVKVILAAKEAAAKGSKAE